MRVIIVVIIIVIIVIVIIMIIRIIMIVAVVVVAIIISTIIVSDGRGGRLGQGGAADHRSHGELRGIPTKIVAGVFRRPP